MSPSLPPDYFERVKAMHEHGGNGSIGWRYDWSEAESLLRVLLILFCMPHLSCNLARAFSLLSLSSLSLPLSRSFALSLHSSHAGPICFAHTRRPCRRVCCSSSRRTTRRLACLHPRSIFPSIAYFATRVSMRRTWQSSIKLRVWLPTLI